MTPLRKEYIEEIKQRLIEEQANTDTEVAHANADRIICELISEIGFTDIVEEYSKVRKWYA